MSYPNITFVNELPEAKNSGPQHSREEFTAIEEALRARPNQWAEVRRFPKISAKGKPNLQGYAFASQCNTSTRKFLSAARGFEAAARTVGAEVVVYIRYTGRVSA